MTLQKIGVALCLLAAALLAGTVRADGEEDFFRGVTEYRARNYTEAVSWFNKAAEQGEADAQFLLGRMYYDGNSISTDYVEAYKWFTIASANGVRVAPRYRDGIARSMTAEQISEGERRSADWLEKFQKKTD